VEFGLRIAELKSKMKNLLKREVSEEFKNGVYKRQWF